MSGISGTSLKRVDGRLKVTGAARYAAEFPFDNMAYGALIESTIARGRILSIDAQAALNAPGVLGIITHLNAPRLHSVKMFPFGPAGQTLLPLQDDIVHYAGQHLAILVADTLEHASDAASLVRITYQEEPPLTTLQEELAQGHEPQELPFPFNRALNGGHGDLESGLAQADVRIEQTYSTPSVHHNPMEPAATTAAWDGDNLLLYDSTQWVSGVRNTVATMLGLPQERVRVVSPFVGGGFGCKCFTWSHVVLTAIAAKYTGRPVKLALTRPQMYTSVGYRPATSQHMMLGATQEGLLTAIRHDGISQTSMFTDYVTPVGVLTGMMYACPNVAITHRLMHVNVGTPTQMRAPGEAPGMFALESAMDELSYALALDPLELRMRNYAEVDPQSGRPWSSNGLRECYRRGAERFGWDRRHPEPRSMRSGDELVGWGMATAAYPVYLSPAAATVKLFANGHALAQSGTQEIGTGTYTVMTQIVADALGLPAEKVRFELGDTDFPKTPVSGAARTVGSVGPAVQAAAQAARASLIEMSLLDTASSLFGYRKDQIAVEDGRLFVRDDPSRGETWAALLARHGLEMVEAYQEVLPAEVDVADWHKVSMGVNAIRGPVTSRFAMYSFGAHFVEVRVDPLLGRVHVTRVVSGFDAGRILNPQGARSQIIGGIVFGVGMALMEETLTDPHLGRIVTANFADYHVPVHADIPDMDVFFVETDDPHVNPLRTKSVGEVSIVGVSAAIANAVYHATGRRIRDLPITLDKLL